MTLPRDDIGGWAEDREHEYLVGTTVSADERLEWLGEMLEPALASGAIPKRRDEWEVARFRARSPTTSSDGLARSDRRQRGAARVDPCEGGLGGLASKAHSARNAAIRLVVESAHAS